MSRIQKVSTYLIWVCNLWLGVMLLPSIFLWIMKDSGLVQGLIANGIIDFSVKTPEGLVQMQKLTFTPLGYITGIIANIIGTLPLFLGVLILKRIFHNYRHGNIFSLENAYKYKQLAWIFFWNAVLAMPISETLSVLSATLCNAPGHRYLVVSFGMPNLGSVLGGIILIVISWIMIEAHKLQADKDLTI